MFSKICQFCRKDCQSLLEIWVRSGAKVRKSCRSRQELSNQIAIQTNIYLQILASIQPRTSLSKFANNLPRVRLKVRRNKGLPTVPADWRGAERVSRLGHGGDCEGPRKPRRGGPRTPRRGTCEEGSRWRAPRGHGWRLVTPRRRTIAFSPFRFSVFDRGELD